MPWTHWLHIARNSVGFPIDFLHLYEIWRAESLVAHSARQISRIVYQEHPNDVLSNSLQWVAATMEDIIKDVGHPLDPLPDHETLVQQVSLLGGAIPEIPMRRIYRIIDVNTLPYPHLPSACQFYPEFTTIEKNQVGPRDEYAVGRRFVEALTSLDLTQCRYHPGDWRAIADVSVQLVEALGPDAAASEYCQASANCLTNKRDQRWLASIFQDPIVIGGGGYTNGQHRGCALRFSGSNRMVVAEFVEDPPVLDLWTYQGDG